MWKAPEVGMNLIPYQSWKSNCRLDAHGGALVNLIHGYAENGDPFIRKFTNQLLEEVYLNP